MTRRQLLPLLLAPALPLAATPILKQTFAIDIIYNRKPDLLTYQFDLAGKVHQYVCSSELAEDFRQIHHCHIADVVAEYIADATHCIEKPDIYWSCRQIKRPVSSDCHVKMSVTKDMTPIDPGKGMILTIAYKVKYTMTMTAPAHTMTMTRETEEHWTDSTPVVRTIKRLQRA